jgi:RNA:NAD 2'-phosphotransferase (TPT1/KptA family)
MPPHHVSVRLDAETLARVDALASFFSTEWHTATRSDILRALIRDALTRFEQGPGRSPAKPGRRRPATSRR